MTATLWQSPQNLVPILSSSDRFTVVRTEKALTVFPHDANLDLLYIGDGRLNASWFGSLAFDVPADTAAEELPFQFRGNVFKGKSSRAMLLVAAGARVELREYPYGTEADEEIFIELAIGTSAPTNRRVTITILLMVERQRLDEQVRLVADSTDAGEDEDPKSSPPD